MQVGKRSTRIWPGVGGQLIRWGLRLAGASKLGAAFIVVAGLTLQLHSGALPLVAAAHAQRAAPATVGPARIVCNASFCEMGSGARPKERVRVIVSNLSQDEIYRLRKCTGVAAPCIVTVDGTAQGDAMKVLASAIRWQE
jgi:hypothetical protein